MSTAAAELLVAARRSGRLTQAELARRAGVPRSVLNTYERGRREPSAAALLRLLAAAGIAVVPAVAVRRPDPARSARILEQVLDLGEQLPTRPRRGAIGHVPFRELASR